MRMLESVYREKSFRKLNDHKKMELYRNLADTTAVANAEMISLKIQKWSNDCI